MHIVSASRSVHKLVCLIHNKKRYRLHHKSDTNRRIRQIIPVLSCGTVDKSLWRPTTSYNVTRNVAVLVTS